MLADMGVSNTDNCWQTEISIKIKLTKPHLVDVHPARFLPRHRPPSAVVDPGAHLGDSGSVVEEVERRGEVSSPGEDWQERLVPYLVAGGAESVGVVGPTHSMDIFS